MALVADPGTVKHRRHQKGVTMGRMNKQEAARRDGFEYFVNLYLKQDLRIPSIDEEINTRKLTGRPIGIADESENKYRIALKVNCVQICVMNAAWVLHDKFGFNREQIQSFADEFGKIMGQYVAEDYVSWQDIHDALKEETGIDFNFE